MKFRRGGHLAKSDVITCNSNPIEFVSKFSYLGVVFQTKGKLRPCSHLFRFAFRTRSSCVPVTRSHLFRNATGTRTVTHPQHIRFLIFGMFSSRRVTALTASRHRRRWSRIDGQIRRCMLCPDFGLQRNFG